MAKSSGDASGSDRRAAPRYAVRAPVRILRKNEIGRGMVHDMSSTGARIEEADMCPYEGARITLEIALYSDATPLILQAEVVRKTVKDGFCVRFLDIDPRLQRVLRMVLPKLAEPIDSPDYGILSGNLELRIGSKLHEQIASLASAEGIEVADWIRTRLEARANQEHEDKAHAASPGHNPATCRDCVQRARGGE